MPSCAHGREKRRAGHKRQQDKCHKRIACEDACGRIVEAHLVPLLVDAAAGRSLDDLARSVTPIVEQSSAPAERYRLADGTTFGIISSTTEPFCRSCDRSRLTADGMWYLCLYATQGIDLRGPLRRGASTDELRALIAAVWQSRTDRGAEERVALGERRAFVPVQDVLKRDPHMEMHTRGG